MSKWLKKWNTWFRQEKKSILFLDSEELGHSRSKHSSTCPSEEIITCTVLICALLWTDRMTEQPSETFYEEYGSWRLGLCSVL